MWALGLHIKCIFYRATCCAREMVSVCRWDLVWSCEFSELFPFISNYLDIFSSAVGVRLIPPWSGNIPSLCLFFEVSWGQVYRELIRILHSFQLLSCYQLQIVLKSLPLCADFLTLPFRFGSFCSLLVEAVFLGTNRTDLSFQRAWWIVFLLLWNIYFYLYCFFP